MIGLAVVAVDVVPEPVTEQAARLESVWWIFVAAAAIVGGIVYGLLAVILVRYRRRDAVLPRQVHYRVGVEIAYTVIPVVIIAGLVAVTLVSVADTEATAAEPDLIVGVEASQWRWRFTYPGDVTVEGDEPELTLPANSSVRFEITSLDVIHSFWVPGFFYKRDAIPGRVERFDIDTTEATNPSDPLAGACAEFCGLDHARMRFSVRLIQPNEFDAWLADQSREADR